LGWLGVELDKPLVTQVSRFDPWKDQPGVIEAYRLVKEEVPALKLALVARWRSMTRKAGRFIGRSRRPPARIRT
jgi:glycosyltransferase involved in cell wall biosynthesis